MAEKHPPNHDNPYQSPKLETALPGGKLARHLFGWALLAVGVAGLALPILPGWFFIAWGVVLLAPEVPFLARLLDRLGKRVPALRAAIDRARGQDPS